MRAITHIALLGLLSLTACALQPRIETLDDLTKALKNNGIQYDSTSPLDFSGMRFAQIDEGVRITGKDLHVELLRVEDDRTFKVVSGAGTLLGALDKTLEDTPADPPEVITRRPFVVVVRAEPEPGQVRRVLDRVLPGSAEG
jgi:hypothetical protein